MKFELTEEQAIALAEAEWYKELSQEDIALFQLFEPRLCMPFSVFHEAIETTLGRPVFIHEFGLNLRGIVTELDGKQKAPSFEDVINLIPEEKRMIVAV